ncbi:hypothetical protein A9257_05245 [Vibrio cyclitrophicus]|nr:hypothetical protein A9257_05245 [Vibrio cyclitrophicus]
MITLFKFIPDFLLVPNKLPNGKAKIEFFFLNQFTRAVVQMTPAQTFGKGQLERVGPFFIFILLAITRKVSF